MEARGIPTPARQMVLVEFFGALIPWGTSSVGQSVFLQEPGAFPSDH